MNNEALGLLIVVIIGWGLWGVFQKIGVSRLGSRPTLLLNFSTIFLVILLYLTLSGGVKVPKDVSLIYPILGGLSVATGTTAFFHALETVPVSLARPIAGLCVLVTALLGVFLLGETLTLRQYVGVVLAITAILLLSG